MKTNNSVMSDGFILKLDSETIHSISLVIKLDGLVGRQK